MPVDLQFGLYEEGAKGRMWRASFADLDRAKSHAQELVKGEGKEFVIYNFNRCREVARIFPAKSDPSPHGTAQKRGEQNQASR